MREPLVSALAVILAMAAGAVGGLAGLVGSGRFVMMPMCLSSVMVLVVLGEFVLAAGMLLFVVILFRDLAATGGMFVEILFLREQSRDHARQAQRSARRDPLTGLLNRAGLDAATAQLRVADVSATAFFIDLDRFKAVNDRFGHTAGDHVLIEAADRLIRTLQPDDVVARLGGDEFLVVIERELTVETRDEVAAAIIANLETPFLVGNFEARISASVGIAVVAAGTFELGAVQREADHALYVAKAQGRRQSVVFDAAARSGIEARAEIETALRRAVENRDIVPWAQPIVDLETGEVIAAEFLARWQLEDGSFCPPSTFIPLAEEIGVIGDLGQQMLEAAGQTLAAWAEQEELSTIAVSVNISARQLGDVTFISAIEQLMNDYAIRPNLLILELTETAELHAVLNVEAALRQLVDLGARLALDDFGAGYSSVKSLLGLPIEYIKLDGSLIKDLGRDPRQMALVRSIRDLASTLGNTVVVECVETQQQAEHLAKLRIRFVQGYLYGRARPISEMRCSMLPIVEVAER